MSTEKDQSDRIRSLLKFHPRGLTISDISQRLKINRNSVSKYLEILQVSGSVEMRALGAAKVYYLSQRIPLATILGFTKEGILVLNAEGRIIQVNERFCAMFNLNQNDILSGTLLDLPPFFSRILNHGHHAETNGDRSEQTRIFRIEQYDWTQFFKIRILNTIFDTGETGRTIIIEDITLEKEMEEQLHLNEARYRGIVEDQSELICRFTPNGRITFANDAFCRTVSLSKIQIGTAFIFDFLSEQSAELLKKSMAGISHGSEVWDMEHEIPIPSGDTSWHHWIYRGIFGEDGKAVEFQGVGHDITDRKKAELELFIKSCAIDSSLMPIGMTSLEGIITYVNPAFLRMWGYDDPHEVIGLPLEHFAHGNLDALAEFYKVKTAVITGEEGYSGEIRSTRRDGTDVAVLLTVSVVRNEAKTPLCLIGYYNDITEKNRMLQEVRIRDTAITGSHEGIALIDRNSRFRYANPAFYRVFNRVKDDIRVGSPAVRLFEKYPLLEDQYSIIEREIAERGNWTGIITDTSEAGRAEIIQLHMSSVPGQNTGDPCTIISAIDITEQRIMEESLALTYRHLEEAIEHMGDPTFILGKDGRIVAWNAAMATLTGRGGDEMIGTRDYRAAFQDLKDEIPLLADLIALPVKDLIRGYPEISRIGDGLFAEAFIPSLHNGTGALIWAKASPVKDRSGRTIGVIQTFKDMTNWKKAADITGRSA